MQTEQECIHSQLYGKYQCICNLQNEFRRHIIKESFIFKLTEELREDYLEKRRLP